MGLLSGFFNKDETVCMPREDLAVIFAPLMLDGISTENDVIAEAVKESAEWLRIGFDSEKEKGTLYHGLYHALRVLQGAVNNSDPNAADIKINKAHLEIIRTSYIQFMEASRNLDEMSKKKAAYQTQYVQDRHGNSIALPFTQIYNRPNAAHDLMGMKLEDIKENLDEFFARKPIKEATNEQLIAYIPRPR